MPLVAPWTQNKAKPSEASPAEAPKSGVVKFAPLTSFLVQYRFPNWMKIPKPVSNQATLSTSLLQARIDTVCPTRSCCVILLERYCLSCSLPSCQFRSNQQYGCYGSLHGKSKTCCPVIVERFEKPVRQLPTPKEPILENWSLCINWMHMSSFWLFWLLVFTAKAELEMLAIASATNVFFRDNHYLSILIWPC